MEKPESPMPTEPRSPLDGFEFARMSELSAQKSQGANMSPEEAEELGVLLERFRKYKTSAKCYDLPNA